MRAVILAAGKGSRLEGASLKPKCLLEVGGVTLLERQLDAVRRAGVTDIVVVVGFRSDSIRRECDGDVRFVDNHDYATTGSLYSLWLAREYLLDGFVMFNSDVLFHPRLLTMLLQSPCKDALLIADADAAQLGDEEMKVRVERGRVVDISKDMEPRDAHGENVGIVKFSADGATALVGYMNSLIEAGTVREWAPRAFREFALHHPLSVVSTCGLPWIEIDFPEDYRRAVAEVYPRIEALLAQEHGTADRRARAATVRRLEE
jgi:choline kinase